MCIDKTDIESGGCSRAKFLFPYKSTMEPMYRINLEWLVCCIRSFNYYQNLIYDLFTLYYKIIKSYCKYMFVLPFFFIIVID